MPRYWFYYETESHEILLGFYPDTPYFKVSDWVDTKSSGLAETSFDALAEEKKNIRILYLFPETQNRSLSGFYEFRHWEENTIPPDMQHLFAHHLREFWSEELTPLREALKARKENPPPEKPKRKVKKIKKIIR